MWLATPSCADCVLVDSVSLKRICRPPSVIYCALPQPLLLCPADKMRNEQTNFLQQGYREASWTQMRVPECGGTGRGERPPQIWASTAWQQPASRPASRRPSQRPSPGLAPPAWLAPCRPPSRTATGTQTCPRASIWRKQGPHLRLSMHLHSIMCGSPQHSPWPGRNAPTVILGPPLG